MLKELKLASQNYVKIAKQYENLVEECSSLEFIAINSGIASKQANNDSFMKLSSEIQIMSNDVTESAYSAQKTAFECVDKTTRAYGDLLILLRFYRLYDSARISQPSLQRFTTAIEKEIRDFDVGQLKRITSDMSRSLESLVALINIGKTMAIGGKIKAVYIKGNEEKFRIITETMQASIDQLFELMEGISIEFETIRSQFSNLTREKL